MEAKEGTLGRRAERSNGEDTGWTLGDRYSHCLITSVFPNNPLSAPYNMLIITISMGIARGSDCGNVVIERRLISFSEHWFHPIVAFSLDLMLSTATTTASRNQIHVSANIPVKHTS